MCFNTHFIQQSTGAFSLLVAGEKASSLISQNKKPAEALAKAVVCGGRGIRTLGTGLSPYNGLANRPFRPLRHLSLFRAGKSNQCLLNWKIIQQLFYLISHLKIFYPNNFLQNNFQYLFCILTFAALRVSGRSVARSSRHIWDVEVASSNLAAPTKKGCFSRQPFLIRS